jgi:hypothetical protein
MSADVCVVCKEALSAVRTTIRRADGTVRYLMCNDCFDLRFCRTCIAYFPSTQEREEHQCPN